MLLTALSGLSVALGLTGLVMSLSQCAVRYIPRGRGLDYYYYSKMGYPDSNGLMILITAMPKLLDLGLLDFKYPLAVEYITNLKITTGFMGKLTISTGPWLQ